MPANNAVQDRIRDFSELTGIKVCACEQKDISEDPVWCIDPEKNCYQCHFKAVSEAANTQGYITYTCPAGCTFALFSERRHDERLYITMGPVLLSEEQVTPCSCTFERAVTLSGPCFESAVSVLMSACSSALTDEISVLEKQNRLDIYDSYSYYRSVETIIDYPIDTEKDLLIAIEQRDRNNAQRILNDLLGYILFSTGGYIDVVKTRVCELLVLISRRVVESGGSQKKSLSTNVDFFKDIWDLKTVDEIVSFLSKRIPNYMSEILDDDTGTESPTVSKVIRFINENYDKDLNLRMISDYVFLSPNYLCKLFKKEMNMTVVKYINLVRINRSRILLEKSEQSIEEVSVRVGFDEVSYFSKVFRDETGISPGRYRQLHRNKSKS